MANQLQNYFESATSIDKLDSILESAVATGAVGAANDPFPLLKIDQASGQLIFGAENIVLTNGSDWVVNPYSFEQGWVSWDVNRTKKGEIMVPLGEKKNALFASAFLDGGQDLYEPMPKHVMLI